MLQHIRPHLPILVLLLEAILRKLRTVIDRVPVLSVHEIVVPPEPQ